MGHFDAVANFRDVGGHATATGARMRSGVVFRSGHLADATEPDLQRLESLGIRTIVDLQDLSDIAAHGEDRLPAGATLIHAPGAIDVSEPFHALMASGTAEEIQSAFPPGSAYELMLALATGWPCDDGRCAQLSKVMRCIIESEGATLVHCAAGKDRTGFAAAVVQLAADVPDEAIVADYIRSNELRRTQIAATLDGFAQRGLHDLLEAIVVLREEYIRGFLESLHNKWGNVEEYFRRGLNLTDHEINSLRERLIEK
jgi:protein-tyrosine phosphatase